MCACIAILLVAVVSSHKMFAITKRGDGQLEIEKDILNNGLLIDKTYFLKRRAPSTCKFEFENHILRVTSTDNFTFEPMLDKNEHGPFLQLYVNINAFKMSSKSPFLGTIKVGSPKMFAHIFLIPDNSIFDEDVAKYAASHFMSLPQSKAELAHDRLKALIDSIYQYPLADYTQIDESLRNSLSEKDRQTLITHLRIYREARKNQNCHKSGITAVTVFGKDVQYSYALENLAGPVEVALGKDGTATFREKRGLTFPTAMGESISLTGSAFLGIVDQVSDGRTIRTYLLANAKPMDILTLLEVLELKNGEINYVYGFAVELFHLALTNRNVIKYLNFYRVARGGILYSPLDITTVTVSNTVLSVAFHYNRSPYTKLNRNKEKIWQVSTSGSGEKKEVVVENLMNAIFPAAMGAFEENTLTVTNPAGAFIGVVGDTSATPLSELTFIFVGMTAKDVLKLTKASESFTKENFTVDGIFEIVKQAFTSESMIAIRSR